MDDQPINILDMSNIKVESNNFLNGGTYIQLGINANLCEISPMIAGNTTACTQDRLGMLSYDSTEDLGGWLQTNFAHSQNNFRLGIMKGTKQSSWKDTEMQRKLKEFVEQNPISFSDIAHQRNIKEEQVNENPQTFTISANQSQDLTGHDNIPIYHQSLLNSQCATHSDNTLPMYGNLTEPQHTTTYGTNNQGVSETFNIMGDNIKSEVVFGNENFSSTSSPPRMEDAEDPQFHTQSYGDSSNPAMSLSTLECTLTDKELQDKKAENLLKLENLRKGFRGIMEIDFLQETQNISQYSAVPSIGFRSQDESYTQEIGDSSQVLESEVEIIYESGEGTRQSQDAETNVASEINVEQKPWVDPTPFMNDGRSLLSSINAINARSIWSVLGSNDTISVSKEDEQINEIPPANSNVNENSDKSQGYLEGNTNSPTKENQPLDLNRQLSILRNLYKLDLLFLQRLQHKCKNDPEFMKLVRNSVYKRGKLLEGNKSGIDQGPQNGMNSENSISMEHKITSNKGIPPHHKRHKLSLNKLIRHLLQEKDLSSAEATIKKLKYYERLLKIKYTKFLEARKYMEIAKQSITSHETDDNEVIIIKDFDVNTYMNLENHGQGKMNS